MTATLTREHSTAPGLRASTGRRTWLARATALLVAASVFVAAAYSAHHHAVGKRGTPQHLDTFLVARAAGLTGYVLVSLGMVLGMLLGARWVRGFRAARLLTTKVHDFVGLLALVFIGVHVLSTAINPKGRWELAWILIPGEARFRPLFTAIGTVTLYLALATWITGRLRRRIPQRVWKAMHATAFLVWVGATVHGLAAGADTRTPGARALYAITATILVILLVARILGSRAPRRVSHPRRIVAIAASVAVMGAMVAFAVTGPLQADWAKRAAPASHSAK